MSGDGPYKPADESMLRFAAAMNSMHNATHLDDGAYIRTTNDGGFVMLADSSEVSCASNKVYLNSYAATELLTYLLEHAVQAGGTTLRLPNWRIVRQTQCEAIARRCALTEKICEAHPHMFTRVLELLTKHEEGGT